MRDTYSEGLKIIKDELLLLPKSPGIYKMIDKSGDILYVGKAKNIKKRVTSYSKLNNQSQRILTMISNVKKLEIMVTNTEVEALLLESNLIKKHKPRFNILLKDDKSFPSILLTSDHNFPQIKKHRGRKIEKGFYFGPFSSAGSVNRSIDALQKGFLIRNCTDNVFKLRTRPCLQFQIKRCTAPCVGFVNQDDYKKQIDQAKSFLSGNSNEIKKNFATNMKKCSDNLDFENAAVWRNKIRALSNIQSFQNINVNGLGDADIIAVFSNFKKTAINISFMRSGSNFGDHTYFFSQSPETSSHKLISEFLSQFYENKIPPKEIIVSHAPKNLKLISEALSSLVDYKIKIICPQKGIRKKLISNSIQNADVSINRKISEEAKTEKNFDEIKKIFKITNNINRIEVYDNSHIQGKFSVGAMIVTTKDGFDKSSYRKYNLKIEDNTHGGNDFGMMEEVIKRRFRKNNSNLSNYNLPDLILIDGGRGHLNTVYKVLKEYQLDWIKVCAISKGADRNAGREKFHLIDESSFTLKPDSLVMFFLQKLRDEAHRFAITAHRLKRKKSISYNQIDEIDGIGNTKKNALLQYFGSAKEVSKASIDDLIKVDGISKNVAQKIYNFFSNE